MQESYTYRKFRKLLYISLVYYLSHSLLAVFLEYKENTLSYAKCNFFCDPYDLLKYNFQFKNAHIKYSYSII